MYAFDKNSILKHDEKYFSLSADYSFEIEMTCLIELCVIDWKTNFWGC
jgi:hypothetical protein